MNPLLILGCGMVIVLGGILVLRMHAFLALVLGAYCVALLTPAAALRQNAEMRVAKGDIGPKAAEKFIARPPAARVADEFGKTCASLGILIAMATILGEAMLRSGAAEAIAAAMLRLLGAARAHWAFFATAYLLCIPVMLDTVMYLLAPLFKAVARRTQRDYLLLVMCSVAGGTITHSLVPPTPGPLFVAGELGVPLGLMIGMGSLIGFGAALSGVAFARWSNSRITLAVPIEETPPPTTARRLPPLWLALVPVLLPIALIAAEATLAPTIHGTAAAILRVVGDKDMALTLGALSALLPLARRGSEAAGAVKGALQEGAVILLLIGAGGAFGGVLQHTGIAGQVSSAFANIHAFALPALFLVTALVRTVQGSATVAMITAAPIAKALIAGGIPIHPVYLAIAIGCGSKPIPWMNDAGFWIIARLSGATESQTLRTISPMMSIQGATGLVLTMIAATVWPMR